MAAKSCAADGDSQRALDRVPALRHVNHAAGQHVFHLGAISRHVLRGGMGSKRRGVTPLFNEDEGIRARPASEDVIAGTAIKRIVARAAKKDIIADAAGNRVISCTTVDLICALTCRNNVIALNANENV